MKNQNKHTHTRGAHTISVICVMGFGAVRVFWAAKTNGINIGFSSTIVVLVKLQVNFAFYSQLETVHTMDAWNLFNSNEFGMRRSSGQWWWRWRR